jgi:hypothetical protein
MAFPMLVLRQVPELTQVEREHRDMRDMLQWLLLVHTTGGQPSDSDLERVAFLVARVTPFPKGN